MKNKLLYFGVLPALVFQLIAAILYFILFKGESFSNYIYFATKILLVVWPLIWLFASKSLYRAFWDGQVMRSLKIGLGSGILIVILVLPAYFGWQDYWLQYAPKIREAAEEFKVLNNYLAFSLFISVLHSLIEEYYWRWFVLNGLLLKFKRNIAVVIGSLAFASHHFIVALQFSNWWLGLIAGLCIFLLAIFWSDLYLKTNSILGSWLSHFFADMVVMGLGYLLIFR